MSDHAGPGGGVATAEGAPPRRQEQEPASTEVVEVGAGVLRLQLPIELPGLGHVNMYALEDERGFAVVDPGLPGPKAWEDLNDRLRRAGIPVARIHTVVVTHSHPDHFGGAGRLAEQSGAEVLTSHRFRTVFDEDDLGEGGLQPAGLDDADSEEAKREAVERILRLAQRPTPWGTTTEGLPAERQAAMRADVDQALAWFTVPRPTVRVADGDPVRLAGRDWFAVETPGHTADHLCLFDPTEGLFLAGDHVLPSITPHISGIVDRFDDLDGRGADPLALYVESLDRVAAFDGVRRVLPAHGHPFTDLPGRVQEVKAHHRERLDRLRELSQAAGWTSVVELSHQLFAPRSWGSMAESETFAHLEHLRLAGEGRRREVDGHLEYLLT